MKQPQLRFPSFSNTWYSGRLENCLKIFNGYAFSSLDAQSNGVRWVKIADVGINQINDSSPSFLPEKLAQKHKKFMLKEGDVILALTRPILNGKLKIAKVTKSLDGALLNQRVGKLECSENLDFFYHLLQRRRLVAELENKIAGTDPPNLSSQDVSEISTSYPTVQEQQKIASFLSSVDERIELLERKKEKLEAYKKGVMQQIFPSTGSGQAPQIRFKQDDGSAFPDWEEKRLGEIGSTYGGLSGKSKDDFGTGKPYIQYMQIFSSSKVDPKNFGLVEISEKERQNSAKVGDVFFTISSETPAEIGTASVLTDDVGEVYLNSFCFGFRPNSLEELNPDFSRYLFRSPQVRRKIVKLAQGSTRYNMSKGELLKQSIILPHIDEQKKIASFLNSIDENLETLDSQIQGLRTWKKGLLQQMFV